MRQLAGMRLKEIGILRSFACLVNLYAISSAQRRWTMRAEWFVYWLFDDTCQDRRRHGCIGATKATRLYARLNQHQHSARIPQPFRYKIIFRGSRKKALALEARLRPRPYIGWNLGVGGFANGKGLKGIPKSVEQRAKIRAAALRRYTDPAEHARTSKAVKRGLKRIDRNGANNPNFGKQMSETTKQKIRDRVAARGGMWGTDNPNYRHGRYC